MHSRIDRALDIEIEMIGIPDVVDKKYAVLGLGKSGLATAESLRHSGADISVWDDQEVLRREAQKAGYAVVDFMTTNVSSFEALLLSPGIPHTYPAPHPIVARFRAADIPLIGDIELLFRACPAARYIGITGTNGKSTTTALIGHILQQAGHKVQIGGNLGTPVLSFEPLNKDGTYVLELSSYQLELMENNRLTIAILLNITPDHLARHGGLEGYIKAKKRIFRHNGPQTVIIGIDEEETASLAREAHQQPSLTVFSLSVKSSVPDGIEVQDGILRIEGEKILDLSSLPHLPGTHNAQNVGAAFAACRAAGLDNKDILRGLVSFPGLAHRQQLVAEIDGIRYINDSKATNADACEKAILCYDNIYWILGGRAKEGGLNGLEKYKSRLRHAYIIGEAAENFAAWCTLHHIPHTRSGTLDKAFKEATTQAVCEKIQGAVVLLSPACASWDQFKNFEDRGDTFISYVHDLSSGGACLL